jgi:hypothetical protein
MFGLSSALLGQEQRVTCHVFNAKFSSAGECVAGGGDEHELVLVDPFGVEPGVFHGESDDAEIDFAVKHGFEGARAVGADDIEAYTGIHLLELAEDLGQDVEAGGFVGADRDLAARGALHLADGHEDVLVALEAVFGEGLEEAAGGGEGHLASGAVEELRSDPGLERADLRRDSGLGEGQLFSGAGEALVASDLEERS